MPSDSGSARRPSISDLYWLTDEQLACLQRNFRKSHGNPPVDDRRVSSGIVSVNRNGLRWRAAPIAYGPHKTLYDHRKRRGDPDVLVRIMEGLAAADGETKTVMIDATYLNARRTASSLPVRNGFDFLISPTKGGINIKLNAPPMQTTIR